MNKLSLLLALSLISFAAILFTPSDTKYWIYPLIAGIVFLAVWFMKKE